MDNSLFKHENLLYRRTTPDTIILSVNKAFLRVNGFEFDELIGQRQSVTSNPDTPAGLFHMLLSCVKNGQPFGGYICERAKTGDVFWGFSIVLPVNGQFVSIRLKPSCAYVDQISLIYEDMLAGERAGSLTPEKSAQQLEKAVHDMGFENYADFQSFVLRDEVVARQAALGRDAPTSLHALGDMFRSVRDLEQLASKVESTFAKTHQIPYNMRLQAGRLEQSDGPISVISANHRLMTQTLEASIARFSAESSLGADLIRLAMLKSAVARLVDETAQIVDAEGGEHNTEHANDLSVLRQLRDCYVEQSLAEVRTLADSVNKFGKRCQDMQRMMSGLELTRIMCKIERSKFDGDHAGLDEIVNRLAEAQDTLRQNFDGILTSVANILAVSDNIQRDGTSQMMRDVA